MSQVFVYGTLRPSQRNYRVVAAHVSHAATARASGLTLYAPQHGGFPYAIRSSSKDMVVGSLLILNDDEAATALAKLDWLEGYQPGADHSHYLRVRLNVRTAEPSILGHSGQESRAWTYLAGPTVTLSDLQPIPSGDWIHQSR